MYDKLYLRWVVNGKLAYFHDRSYIEVPSNYHLQFSWDVISEGLNVTRPERDGEQPLHPTTMITGQPGTH